MDQRLLMNAKMNRIVDFNSHRSSSTLRPADVRRALVLHVSNVLHCVHAESALTK